MGSGPVRVGNAAFGHVQLDIYGELMDSVYLYDKYGQPISYGLCDNLSRLVDGVCRHSQPAHGPIGAVRGPPRDFLFSRVRAWAAINRPIRLANKRAFPGPIERWRET